MYGANTDSSTTLGLYGFALPISTPFYTSSTNSSMGISADADRIL